MTKPQARALLTAARNGEPVTRWSITKALKLTGDLTPFRQAQIRKLENQERTRARDMRLSGRTMQEVTA